MRYVRYLLPPLILGLILLVFFLTPKLIVIKSIECSTQYGECYEEFNNKFKDYQGKNLDEVKIGISSFLKDNVLVSDFNFQFQLPDRLKVGIVLRKAKFAIWNQTLNKFSLIDRQGYVLAIAGETNLPYVVTLENLPSVGDRVSQKTFFSLEIIYDMFYLYQIKEAKLEDDSLEVMVPPGIKVIFPLEGEKDTLVGALRIILFRLNEGSEDLRIENVNTIDLRFKNPVLK